MRRGRACGKRWPPRSTDMARARSQSAMFLGHDQTPVWHPQDRRPAMFATGIENSYPTIHNRGLRVDELEKCGHYTHWRTDFDLLDDLNIHTLRYGPPIHKTWLGQGRYDWEFADLTFGELRRRNIIPIV